MAIKISFLSGKGGVGNSTLTILLANYLHYVKKKKVIILDCEQQSTISLIRSSEIKVASPPLSKRPYEVISLDNCSSDKVLNVINIYNNFYDYMLLDLPYNFNKDDNECIGKLDFIFIPFTSSIDLSSNFQLFKSLEITIKKNEIKVFGILNKIISSKRGIEMILEIENSTNFEITMLKNIILYSFNSIFDTNALDACNEIYSILSIKESKIALLNGFSIEMQDRNLFKTDDDVQ